VTSDLQNVLRPAFLDRFSTSGLRRFDTSGHCRRRSAGELAMLLVKENVEGKLKIRKL
jgi:hypothetical protein